MRNDGPKQPAREPGPPRRRRPPPRRVGRALLCVATLTTLLVVGTEVSAAAQRQQGGTVRFAEPPGSPLNYVFPFDPITTTSVNDVTQLQMLLWRPLSWFGSDESVARLDPTRTLYQSVTYSDRARVVSVRLKAYRWSDGYPVTSRDVEFSYDLYRYEKGVWADYVPGEFPDNVASVRLPDSHTIVFTLTHQVNEAWFTDDQLSLITPMPQHAWDRTSVLAPVGDADLSAAGAGAVFDFLDAQATDTATYATNPLWQVVDGPWKLSAFSAEGGATFVPNPAFSGPGKATIAQFVEVPFSTTADEVAALRAGGLDVGYLPITEPGAVKGVEASGYRLAAWDNLAIAYGLYDFGNPVVGPLLSELYIRRAIQGTEDQGRIARAVFGGFASPTTGPVPLQPQNGLASAYERSHPNGYDPAAARALLTAHGWKVRPGGTDVCERGGSGAGRCGGGITAGTRLRFSVLYPSGSAAIAREVSILRAGAERAGIALAPETQSFEDVVSTVDQCPSACSWQIALYAVTATEPVLPTGDTMFLPGAALNAGGYRDAAVTAAIVATLRSNRPGVFTTYEDDVARQLPWLWLPTPPFQLTMIRSDLRGAAPQNTYLAITPEDYFFVR